MKIVIIGGVAAGAKVAAKANRLKPDAEITIYTDDTHISYSSCGLTYYIQRNFEDYNMLLVRSPEEFEAVGVKVFLRHKAIRILPETKQVLIRNLDNDEMITADYDKLVIATGARPAIPQINNVNIKNVFTVRKIEDGINIRNKALQSKHVTVIGSGYIGLELLEAFVKLGLFVTVIEFTPLIAPNYDDDISSLILEQLLSQSANRFEILTSQLVTEFEANENNEVIKVKTNSGKVIDTDMVVIAAGVKPNVEIAQDAGVAIGETGAIKVSKHMKTNIDDIYACGDCAEKTFLINGAKVWVPLGSTANKEGRVAAINVCGGDEEFEGILGSTVVRCLSLNMSKTGLTEKAAKRMGFNTISATVTKNDKVGYMPDVNNITLKLIADSATGLLLGGQAIGSGDADKRINTLATALLGRLTIEEFTCNDLTYAPPYSPTIDPLLNAAQILNKIYYKNKS